MLNKRQGGTFKYLKIKEGKLKISGIDELYDEVSGFVKDINIEEASYEGRPYEQLTTIIDAGEDGLCKLQMNFDSTYAQSYLSRLNNVDFSKEILIVPIEKDEIKNGVDVKKRSILLQQDGVWLKACYTKDNPNGLPPMKKVVISGKTMYDRTDMLNFYRDLINVDVKPRLASASPVVKPETNDDDDSDLPF